MNLLCWKLLTKRSQDEKEETVQSMASFERKKDSSAGFNGFKMIISSTGGNTSNMPKHLSTQLGLKTGIH